MTRILLFATVIAVLVAVSAAGAAAGEELTRENWSEKTGFKPDLGKVPFKAGDTIKVHFRVIEGSRQRIQVFEGIVIKRQGAGARETFTVRKISQGIGVERTFPVHSPVLEKIEVERHGLVRRAKLYYLRERKGKAARIAEKRDS